MTISIYDKHASAFNDVNAYVIINETNCGIERLATIAFKRGKTGNVKCFLHVISETMVMGSAGGYGYDKPSAAFYDAASKHFKNIATGLTESDNDKDRSFVARQLLAVAEKGNGSSSWDLELREQGLTILQAV